MAVPELVTYALMQSFSLASHHSGHNFASPIALDMDTSSAAGSWSFPLAAIPLSSCEASNLHKYISLQNPLTTIN